MTNKQKKFLRKQIKIAIASKSFWEFCKAMAPSFYTEEKIYLKNLCYRLEAFLDSDKLFLFVSQPPQSGKSLTVKLYELYVLGKNIQTRIITASYNTMVSLNISQAVRDKINEESFDDETLVYHDIFPNVHLKRNASEKKKWQIEGSYQPNYLSSSPNGTLTSFAADLFIVDDIIKDATTALNENALKKIEDWYHDTVQSRQVGNCKTIFVMTRWSNADLTAVVKRDCEKVGIEYEEIVFRAIEDDGTILKGYQLTPQRWKLLQATMSKEILEANYNQKPIDGLEGRLFKNWKTYVEYREGETKEEEKNRYLPTTICAAPPSFDTILSYVDGADTGEDFFCGIIFGVYKQKLFFLDCLFTQEAVEYTEPMFAKMLNDWGVNHVLIERNNGGRQFERNIKRILELEYENTICYVEGFTQSNTKITRILNDAHNFMRFMLFPINVETKFAEYFDQMSRYQRKGKNAHDDAPDASIGCIEMARALGYIDTEEYKNTTKRYYEDEDEDW